MGGRSGEREERAAGGWSGQQKEVMFYGDYVHRIAPLLSHEQRTNRAQFQADGRQRGKGREGSSITKAWDEFGIVDTSSFA